MPLDVDKPIKKKRPKARKAKTSKMQKPKDLLNLEEKLSRPEVLAARAKLKKKYGENALFGVDREMPTLKVIPTGFTDLDLRCIAGGVKAKAGMPRGFIIEVFGPEAGGKSTFLMNFVAHAQSLRNHCVWIDLERTLDKGYAANIGIDTEKWDYCIPADGDEAVDMALMWINAGADVIVLDSVGVLDTKEDIDRPLEDHLKVAGPVHLMKKCLMKCAKPLYDQQGIFFLINHIRAVMNPKPWQEKEQTPLGHRLKHTFVLRIRVTKGAKLKKGDVIEGVEMRITIAKNKIGPPGRKTILPIMFGEGISRSAYILEEAIRADVIQRKGAYYTIDEQTFQGKDAARIYLKANPDVLAWIERQVEGTDEDGTDYDETPPTEDGGSMTGDEKVQIE